MSLVSRYMHGARHIAHVSLIPSFASVQECTRDSVATSKTS